ncbi:unnamed protein product [Linum trigynum]|uniref:Reverse transcriptase domain-containing protein n=1 Tax=Linum trigynum TaxID=586398 RepID=A0AAV2C737_9ROSI
MEPLSSMLNRAVLTRQIPFHPQCKAIGLTRLSFADDLLIFTEGSSQALECLRNVLDVFYRLSGLRCNPLKCEVFFGGMAERSKQLAQDRSGFKEGRLSVRYLGVPLQSGSLSSIDCNLLIDKLASRIRSWRANKLTYAGKLQLISSVLYSITQFWMTVFMLPKKVINRIQKVCSDFLWYGEGTGRAKARWDLICLPKKEGGLGLRDLYTWNVACVWQNGLDASHAWGLVLGGLDRETQVKREITVVTS